MGRITASTNPVIVVLNEPGLIARELNGKRMMLGARDDTPVKHACPPGLSEAEIATRKKQQEALDIWPRCEECGAPLLVQQDLKDMQRSEVV